MSHEITLKQAMDRAEQVEVICRLVENYPLHLEGSDISSIASLLARLSGNVFCWLSEESVMRESEKNGK